MKERPGNEGCGCDWVRGYSRGLKCDDSDGTEKLTGPSIPHASASARGHVLGLCVQTQGTV